MHVTHMQEDRITSSAMRSAALSDVQSAAYLVLFQPPKASAKTPLLLAGKAAAGGCTLHAGTCIVSDALEQQLREQVLSEARQAAETAQQQRRAASNAASTSQPSPGQQKASNAKSGARVSTEALVQLKCWMQPDQDLLLHCMSHFSTR